MPETFLCIGGPRAGERLTHSEATKAKYQPFNRAYGGGRKARHPRTSYTRADGAEVITFWKDIPCPTMVFLYEKDLGVGREKIKIVEMRESHRDDGTRVTETKTVWRKDESCPK